MKAKKFNYEKHGRQFIELVERNDEPKTYKFWFRISSQLDRDRLDDVTRRSEQWRRIYYTAKRKQRAQEVIVGVNTCIPIPSIPYKNVDIADQLSEINRKLDALSGLINVCLPLRHRVVL